MCFEIFTAVIPLLVEEVSFFLLERTFLHKEEGVIAPSSFKSSGSYEFYCFER
ncbi:hypothetical protein BSM4216_2637 [Bacillus smithii]|nr:hypothetical protein BSM4216_2637 [Bacillus smithii]